MSSSKSHRKKRCKSSKSSRRDSSMGLMENDTLPIVKYDIKTSKAMGRYMVSKKDIRPGEIIVSEEPLVVGPCSNCKVQCLGCYQNLEHQETIFRCPNCMWPLCSIKCPGLKTTYGHTEIECTILQECQSGKLLNYENLQELRMHYQTIVPLRCLILKTTDPSGYATLLDMESHNEIRKKIPDLWKSNQEKVVDRIVKQWQLTEFSEQEIHTICGILEVNSFEIGQQGVSIRGIYPTSFLLSHDCVPNTNHTDEEETFKLTIRASIHIPAGYPITLSYAYTLQGTQKRREHLLENKFFECKCRRCTDPTELGTFTGALICPKCENGLVLCDNPLDFDSKWSCRKKGTCPGYSISASSMTLLLDKIAQEAEDIDGNDIPAMESFLQKYRNVLHPTHYLCLGVKVSLSQMYGRISGHLIHALQENHLLRKKEICQEILKVFDVIEPGYTRIRGVTLYELHAPIMLLLSRRMENGDDLQKNEVKATLKDVIRYLVEASVILSYEPPHSPEGIMGKAAKDALNQIKDWEKIVGKLK
ncbi:hypothetical protein ABEB36_009968 [Hypothenemus hampei]|uniref:SET domain-containing protein n=1 Tax=Hypothenemus hampei TaxID=57062 RepID=A0ABD1EIK2_HYPHA